MALAANGRNLAQATITMAAFGAGMAGVFLGIGFASRSAFARHRRGLSHFAAASRKLFGMLLAAVGVSVLSGLDKIVEAFLTRAMPDWLLDLSTRF